MKRFSAGLIVFSAALFGCNGGQESSPKAAPQAPPSGRSAESAPNVAAPSPAPVNSLPPTGGQPYVALVAGSINESLAEGTTTTVDREVDGQNPPQLAEGEELIQKEDGKSYVRRTEFRAEVPSIGIGGINLAPANQNGANWIVGSVTIMNASRKNTILDVQLYLEQGGVRTVLVGPRAKDRQNKLNSLELGPGNGAGFVVRTPIKQSSGAQSLVAEIVIDGPPGLIVDRKEIYETKVDAQGRELPNGPPNFNGRR